MNRKLVKKISISALLFAIGASSAINKADASFIMNYQSQFMKGLNQYEDRHLDLRFSLWKNPTKQDGDIEGDGDINTGATNYASYTEEFLNIVPNNEGIVDLKLGSTITLPDLNQNIHKYLQVEVKVNGESKELYEILDPKGVLGDSEDRREMGASPYAFSAKTIDGKSVGSGSGNIVSLGNNGLLDVAVVPGATNSSSFRIDMDGGEDTGDLKLEFGDQNTYLKFNLDESLFKISNDLDFQGNEAKKLVLQNSGSDITAMGEGQVYYNTTDKKVKYFDETSWNALGEGGDTLTNFTLDLNPEFQGLTIFQDGTSNKGTLVSDFESSGTLRSYYQWSSANESLQDVNLKVKLTLPTNFNHFDPTQSLVIDYKTNTNSADDNKIDISAYYGSGEVIPVTGTTSLANNSWSQTALVLNASEATASSDIILDFKMSAKNSNFSRLGKISLKYIK